MKPTPRATFVLLIATLLAGCARQAELPEIDPSIAPTPEHASAESDWPRTFTDALGNEVTLYHPPERIISLSTGITESIFAMGAGDRVVGRLHFSTHPPEVLDVPSVGGLVDPSLEVIVSQEPDLVLTERGTPRDIIDSIERLGIPVIAYDPVGIPEVLEMIREVGRCLGVDEEAHALVARLEERIEALSVQVFERARQGRPSVLFVVGLDPVFAAGGGHFVDDMITTAGGINAVTLLERNNNGEQWPSLSLEAVVSLDPDIIVIAMMLQEDLEATNVSEAIDSQPGWNRLSAVEGDRVYTLNPDLALRAGPRLFDALEEMNEIIEDALSGGVGDG